MNKSFKDNVKKIISSKFFLFPAVLVCVFLVVHFFWFRGYQFIYYWDQAFSFNPTEAIKSFGYLWRNNVGFGNPDVTGINYLPLLYLYSFFQKTIGLSLGQQIVITAEITIALLGFRLLVKELLKNKIKEGDKINKIAWVGAIFYVINPFAIIYIWRLHLNPVFFYVFFPLIFIALTRLFNEKQKFVKNLILLNFLLLLCLPSFSHPAYLMAFGLFVTFYLVFLIGQSFKDNNKKEILLNIIKYAIFWIVWLLLNFWWVIPQIFGIKGTIALSGNDGAAAIDIVRTTTSQTSFLNVLRLLGEWHYYDYHFGAPDFRIMSYFTNFLSIFGLLFFIPIGIIIASYRKNKSLFKILLGLLIVALLLFIGGERSIIWPIIKVLYENISIFRAFRNPYEKIGIIYTFAYSVLLIIALADFQKSKFFNKLLILTVLPLLLPLYIFISGKVVPSGTDRLPSARMNISDNYKTAADFLGKNVSSTDRILILPFQHSPLQLSDQGKSSYVGQDILTNSTYLPTIAANTGNINNDLVLNELDKEVNAGNVSLLDRYGIKYVVVDDTLRNSLTYGTNNSIDKLKQYFDKTNQFKKSLSLGNLTIYENTAQRPVVYTSDLSNINISKLPNVAATIPSLLPNRDLLSCIPKGQEKVDYYSCDKGLPITEEITREDGDVLVKDSSVSVTNNLNLPAGQYKVNIDGFSAEKAILNGEEINSSNPVTLKGKGDQLTVIGGPDNFSDLFNSNAVSTKLATIPLDVNASKGQNSFEIVNNLSDSSTFIQTANQGKYASYIEVKNDGQPINVSFYYKNDVASGPTSLGVTEGFGIFDYNKMMQNSIKEYPLGAVTWQKMNFLYYPTTNSDNIYFYLISDGTGSKSNIKFTNIEINEVKVPRILFTSVGSNDSGKQSDAKIEQIKMINPTHYQITMNNPNSDTLLNFQNNFDQNWKLTINHEVVSEDNHYVLNGTGNSWIINKNGNLQIDIEYKPQQKFLSYKKVSLSAIIGLALVGLIALILSKNAKKNN